MISASLQERIRTFAADDAASAMAGALLVNQCLEESLDVGMVEDRLRSIVEGYRGELEPWQHLKELGFGSGLDVTVPAGSRTDVLLTTREGLPITLGTLLIHISDAAGLDARGINFPGRFLVRVDQALVDPFVMKERTREECLAALPEDISGNGLSVSGVDPFEEAPPSAILLRMLNNLKNHYASQDEFHKALDMVECQLGVLPGDAGLLLEQGEFWLGLGSVGAARRAFTAAEVAASSGDAQRPSEIGALAKRRLAMLPENDGELQ